MNHILEILDQTGRDIMTLQHIHIHTLCVGDIKPLIHTDVLSHTSIRNRKLLPGLRFDPRIILQHFARNSLCIGYPDIRQSIALSRNNCILTDILAVLNGKGHDRLFLPHRNRHAQHRVFKEHLRDKRQRPHHIRLLTFHHDILRVILIPEHPSIRKPIHQITICRHQRCLLLPFHTDLQPVHHGINHVARVQRKLNDRLMNQLFFIVVKPLRKNIFPSKPGFLHLDFIIHLGLIQGIVISQKHIGHDLVTPFRFLPTHWPPGVYW